MFHQAMKPATMPNPPPAFWTLWFGTPSTLSMYAMPSIRKVSQTVKKSEEKATVDFSVHSQRMNVKMNQPCDQDRVSLLANKALRYRIGVQ